MAVQARWKLVRDQVPQLIRDQGLRPVTHIADDEEYDGALRRKLQEEVGEFLAADSTTEIAELVDIVEVARALAATLGVTPERLEELREAKAYHRGGFNDRVIWHGNEPEGED